jgi:translation initiation factor 2 alpha subunit (eIF-2alpha)
MQHYSSSTPKVGQVVLGYLLNEKEEENCLYVRVPEYGNIEGMIPKSNLPKKRRTFKRVLGKMRKEKIVPCVMKTKPRLNDDGTPWPLDLTLRRIDRDMKQMFIDRYENVGRILKVFKYLSEETDAEYMDLAAGIWQEDIVELFADRIVNENDSNDSDDSDDSDANSQDSEASDSPQVVTDLSDLYQKVIGNFDYMIELIRKGYDLNDELETQIRSIMADHSHAKKADCSIQFDFRVDDADDPVEVLQTVFTTVMEANPNISIQYRGAPSYVAIKPDVGPEDLEDAVNDLEEVFQATLTDVECTYHLAFSLTNSEAKEPVYSFSFPREIKV